MTTMEPAERVLSVSRSKTMDQFSSTVAAKPPQMKFHRNASNGDIMGRHGGNGSGNDATGYLQRSHSLDTSDFADQFKRSLSINDVQHLDAFEGHVGSGVGSSAADPDGHIAPMNQEMYYNSMHFQGQNRFQQQIPQIPSSFEQQQHLQGMMNGVFTPQHMPLNPHNQQSLLTPAFGPQTPFLQPHPSMGMNVPGGSPLILSGQRIDPFLYGSPIILPGSPAAFGMPNSPTALGNFQLPGAPAAMHNNAPDRILSGHMSGANQGYMMQQNQRMGAHGMNATQLSPFGATMAYPPMGYDMNSAMHQGMPPMAQKTRGERMLEELRMKLKASSSTATLNYNTRYANQPNKAAMAPTTPTAYEEIGINWELRDIKDCAFDFAKDQFGSRFIQHKLQDSSVPDDEKQALFDELSPSLSALCTDVFGNYVLQKLLELGVGTKEQHNYIYHKAVKGSMYDLSSHMYGCRVIQKLIDQIFGYTTKMYQQGKTPSQIGDPEEEDDIYDMAVQDRLLSELRKDVPALVTDQNGNHVIQKCIEQIRPISRLDFFFDSFRTQYMTMSKHPYGCRVVQRVLENTNVSVIFQVISEIMTDLKKMIIDQYANYVVQHIIEHQHQYELVISTKTGKPNQDPKDKELVEGIARYRQQIFEVVAQHVGPFSQHKFGSNVVECCLKFGSPDERDLLVNRILEGSTLIMMMKDPYANYVVQKVIDKAKKSQLEKVVTIVQQNQIQLRRLTYGKHIINKLKALNPNI